MTHHARYLLCLAVLSALLWSNPQPASARFCNNDPVNNVDPLGLEPSDLLMFSDLRTAICGAFEREMKDMIAKMKQSTYKTTKKTVYYGQNMGGFLPSVLTGEYFTTPGQSPVKAGGQKRGPYLITIAGMSNTTKENKAFPRQLLRVFPDMEAQIDENYGYVNNPANLGSIWTPLGTAQSISKMPFHEFGMNTRPVVTGVSMIRTIVADAERRRDKHPVIYIVAHSQGTEILAHIIRALEPSERRCLRIMTFAPEHPIADTGEYGYVTNYVGKNFDIAYDLGRLAPDRVFNRYSTTLTPLPACLSHPRISYINYFGEPDPRTGVIRGLPCAFLCEE